MSLIHIGGGNYINEARLVSAVLPDSAPIKRVIQDARKCGMLIDATYGKRTKSVLIMDSGHVVLSFKSPPALFPKRTNPGTDVGDDAADGAGDDWADGSGDGWTDDVDDDEADDDGIAD
jgi:regulator of extracellular matrix RemA (YlzA/DUF370 family)